MKKLLKLSTLLAITDSLAPYFKNMIGDYNKFFKGNQGAFLGIKKTYEPKEGTVDEPTKRGNVLIQTTVKDKLIWFKENASEYIDALFSQEKTNASGIATAELKVGDKVWGTFSSLELLRLKSVVSAAQLEQMLASIPVRSDSKEWAKSSDEMYKDKEVYETPLISGVNITTTKEDYILTDPNIGKSISASYSPQVAQKTTIVELGNTTTQSFSGEMSQRERAGMLRRRTTLLTAITKALKECNDIAVINSEMTSDKIFGYLFDI